VFINLEKCHMHMPILNFVFSPLDLEVPKPLAYNYELRMIGFSNIVSGLTGGYTGSYIFSQSIFSLRAGIRSRLAGYTTALAQAITVVMPISILAFVPNFVFASLLLLICVDLMIEWLWEIRHKLTTTEYVVALATFAFIQVLGVQYGILAAVGFHIVLVKSGCHDGTSKDTQDGVNETSPILQVYEPYNSASGDYEIGLSYE